MASGGMVRFGFDEHLIGPSVRCRFVTTLHCIASAVIKLSRLQPKGTVFRGMNGMKLPRSFVQPDACGVRSGVEYGFMSATLDRSVAVRYSRGKADNPSLILEMEMGMVNRGAFLMWLSQYPDEREVLLPPLTGLEVSSYTESTDGTLVYTMQLNINMQSMTIEQVLALRKKQCTELAQMVSRDLASHIAVGDIPQRQHAAEQLWAAVEAEPDANVFNENARFVRATEALIAQLPRAGDQLEVFQRHRRPAFALAIGRRAPRNRRSVSQAEPLLLSGSWDGTVTEVGSGAAVLDANDAGSPVLSLAVLDDFAVAVRRQDGSVTLTRVGSRTSGLLVEVGGPVTSLAWLPERRWLACGSDGVVVWEICSGVDQSPVERWRSSRDEGAVRGPCWTLAVDRPWLVTTSLGHGSAKLWDITGSVDARPQLTLDGHNGAVTAVASFGEQDLARTGLYIRLLATASSDRSIRVWALPSGKELARARDTGAGVCALAAIGGARLASGSVDATVKLWQLPPAAPHGGGQQLELLATLTGHSGPVAFLDSEGWLASGGTDGSVQLWRAEERRVKPAGSSETLSAEVVATAPGDEVALISREPLVKVVADNSADQDLRSLTRCSQCSADNIGTSVTCHSCGELLLNDQDEPLSPSSPVMFTSVAVPVADVAVDSSSVATSTVRPERSGANSDDQVSFGTACTECGVCNEGTAVTCSSCGELLI